MAASANDRNAPRAASSAPSNEERSVHAAPLLSDRPELAAQWHPTRNGDARPSDVAQGSSRRVWWKCSAGPDHEWRATPLSRTRRRGRCPFCADRRLSVTNSLAARRPDLASQWHTARNEGLTPDRIVWRSSRPVWWACGVASDHEWRASPKSRSSTKSNTCPYCSGRRVTFAHALATAQPSRDDREPPPEAGEHSLRARHRSAAQALALLADAPGIDATTVQRVTEEIRTLLATTHPGVRGAAERSSHVAFDEIARRRATLKHLLRGLDPSDLDPALRSRHLRALARAFRDYAHLVEALLLA